MEVTQRINQLRQQLNRHNHLYYVDAAPEISDHDYDRLMQELIDLEKAHPSLVTPDSPTQRVGGQPIDGFQTVQHAVRMMSIDNTYNAAEVREFDGRIRKALGGHSFEYVMEPKIDGLAASLRYEKGLLVLAATRGDGRRGDDVTANAKTIGSIPLRLPAVAGLPDVLEVRGEIYMANADFAKMNQRLTAAGEEPMKNPRNATAGTLKQLDPKIVAQRKLRFLAHGVGQISRLPADNYWDWLQYLKTLHLPVADQIRKAATIDQVIAWIDEFAKVRPTLPFATDGLVIKVNSFAQRDHLGQTDKYPRWAIAYKYQPEQAETLLLNVTWQVGKGGTLTPVAELKPVDLAGSTIQRATLHNIDQIQTLDLYIGDTVIIEKAGEVIPKVVQAIPKLRPSNAKLIEIPQTCPSCNTPIKQEANTPFIRCYNPECPAQLKERLCWFSARNQMNIEGLGTEIISHLVDAGKLRHYADLYSLNVSDIANIEREVSDRKGGTRSQRIGSVIAMKIIKAIANSKSAGLAKVLSAIAISGVGETYARHIAEWAGNLNSLLTASETDIWKALGLDDKAEKNADNFYTNLKKVAAEIPSITELNPTTDKLLSGMKKGGDIAKRFTKMAVHIGISEREAVATAFPLTEQLLAAPRESVVTVASGKAVAKSIKSFLSSATGRLTLERLKMAEVQMDQSKMQKEGSQLSGLTLVVTGSFDNYTREDIHSLIRRHGGIVADSITQSTSILIAGEKAGTKLSKAREYGIKVLPIDDFLKLIGHKDSNISNTISPQSGQLHLF